MDICWIDGSKSEAGKSGDNNWEHINGSDKISGGNTSIGGITKVRATGVSQQSIPFLQSGMREWTTI